MFKKKKNKTEELAEIERMAELKEKISHELFVRNMPVINKRRNISENISAPELSSTGLTSQAVNTIGQSSQSHRMIGLIIIIGGLLLIGGLVYLSYFFVIKPSLTNDYSAKPASTTPVSVVATPTNALEIIDEEASRVEELNPVVLDIATTTIATSSAEDLLDKAMAEEGVIADKIDLEPVLDSDGDELFDAEELIFGTDINKVDTNNNTYPDLIEVNNNYNPAGTGTLISNPGLAIYTDNIYDYKIIYPRDWEFSSLNNNQVLIFTAPDESLIQISIQENFDKEEMTSWYLNLFPDNLLTYDKIKIKDTWEGVESPDSLNLYLTDNSKKYIYTISYIPAVTDHLVYPNIFKMMINSLILPI